MSLNEICLPHEVDCFFSLSITVLPTDKRHRRCLRRLSFDEHAVKKEQISQYFLHYFSVEVRREEKRTNALLRVSMVTRNILQSM